MDFYSYIIYSSKRDRYYIGSCEDRDVRLNQHNSRRNNSTKSGAPWIMVYFETFQNRSDAVKREVQIKSMKSRKYIETLIKLTERL